MSSSGVDTIIGSIPKKKSFTVVSLFESGLADFDNNVAFINIDTLDEFMSLGSVATRLLCRHSSIILLSFLLFASRWILHIVNPS